MFTLAFHAFLRIGEITVQSLALYNPNLLNVSQLSLDHRSITITFNKFKHSQSQKFTLTINKNKNATICPVLNLQRYINMRGLGPGPIFTNLANIHITRAEFNAQLTIALQFCSFDPEYFKNHSFRIGAATTADMQGFSDSQIRQLGRWKSDAFKRYIRCSERHSNL